MGTAFSSSLFGLGGSLALGFLDLQAGQAQNAFFNQLEEWLSGVTRLSSGAGDSEQGVSVYTEALLEQTAERLQELQNIMNRGEQQRASTRNQQFSHLNAKLSILADQMRAEQQLLLKDGGKPARIDAADARPRRPHPGDQQYRAHTTGRRRRTR